MSTTFTTTSTFTRTHARYLASKVAGDLRQMQLFYERPSETEVVDYIVELTELLAGGFLASIEYGFRNGSGWAVALRYVVSSDGSLVTDDRSGRVPIGVDVSSAYWYSYLRLNGNWDSLTSAERERITSAIPVKRSGAPEPTVGAGFWTQQKTYSANCVGMTRFGFQKL